MALVQNKQNFEIVPENYPHLNIKISETVGEATMTISAPRLDNAVTITATIWTNNGVSVDSRSGVMCAGVVTTQSVQCVVDMDKLGKIVENHRQKYFSNLSERMPKGLTMIMDYINAFAKLARDSSTQIQDVKPELLKLLVALDQTSKNIMLEKHLISRNVRDSIKRSLVRIEERLPASAPAAPAAAPAAVTRSKIGEPNEYLTDFSISGAVPIPLPREEVDLIDSDNIMPAPPTLKPTAGHYQGVPGTLFW